MPDLLQSGQRRRRAAKPAAPGREAGAAGRRIRFRYLNVIMSVRLSVEAFAFSGSLARFAVPEFNML